MPPFSTPSLASASFGSTTPTEFPTWVSFSAIILASRHRYNVCTNESRMQASTRSELREAPVVPAQEGAASGVGVVDPGFAGDAQHRAVAAGLELQGVADAQVQGRQGVIREDDRRLAADLLDLQGN